MIKPVVTYDPHSCGTPLVPCRAVSRARLPARLRCHASLGATSLELPRFVSASLCICCMRSLVDLFVWQHLFRSAGLLLKAGRELSEYQALTTSKCPLQDATPTPKLPTKIIPTKIRWLEIDGKFPMDMRIPPLSTKFLLESNPLKSRICVRRLAVLSLLLLLSSLRLLLYCCYKYY